MLPDWIELCNLLNAHSVEYLVVGGQAVIAHGYPRLTKDMDLLVRPIASNVSRILAPLPHAALDRKVLPHGSSRIRVQS